MVAYLQCQPAATIQIRNRGEYDFIMLTRRVPVLVLASALLAWLAVARSESIPVTGALADRGASVSQETTAQIVSQQPDRNANAFRQPFERLWAPWTGDLPGMIERRVIRVVVPFGGYQFYYDGGAPKGAVFDLLKQFENHLNKELGRKNIRIHVAVIPMSRDQLFPALLNGNADLIAADLTETDSRAYMVDFTRPLLTDIDEIVVTGPAAPDLETLDDLAGREVFVRASSSYFEHLAALIPEFFARNLEPPIIVAADELLETHDILEMLNAGLVDVTIVDDYKAEFWSTVFPDIRIYPDLKIHEDGQTSWAYRKESPEFAAMLNGFMRRYGKGTLVGNDTYSRYLSNAERVSCASTYDNDPNLDELESAFRESAAEFDLDWLMLAAQGFQESRFHHGRRSPAGAVGIMQIKPSTAADRNVGIPDISSIQNNVRAGAKYMRFLIDRYFADTGMNGINQWLFGLAAYNAGPARVRRLRAEAEQEGRDPNLWFDNVEIVAGRRIGRETVTYVSNIYKYFVGYHLIESQTADFRQRFGSTLRRCAADS